MDKDRVKEPEQLDLFSLLLPLPYRVSIILVFGMERSLHEAAHPILS